MLSLRSRRQHKAWGTSPRIRTIKNLLEPAKRATAVLVEGCRPLSRARAPFSINDAGAAAPGFMLTPASRVMLTPASRAKTCRPLPRAKS